MAWGRAPHRADGLARLRLQQKHKPADTRVLLVQETAADRAYGGRVVVEWLRCAGGAREWVRALPPRDARCTDGDDRGELEFAPPSFKYLARYRPNYGPLTGAGPAGAMISLAMGSGRNGPSDVDQWERVGHPLLFTAAIDRTARRAGPRGASITHVRGTFALHHRPDLFPPDEIQPEFELPRDEVPEPAPRIPLRAR